MHQVAIPEEKRDLLETLTSNRLVACKNAEFMLKTRVDLVANRFENSHGGPTWGTDRTWDLLLLRLAFLPLEVGGNKFN